MACMARIALADLYNREARRRPRLVVPHAQDLGYTGGRKRAPNSCCGGDAFEETGLVHWLVLRRAAEDWVIAIENGLHVQIRPLLRIDGVVSHPFTERALRQQLAGNRLALNGNLAIGWYRKARIRASHHVDRLAAQPPSDVELTDLGRRTRRQQEQQGVLATQDHD